MTLQDRLICGLLRLGYHEVHPPRQGRKYRIFSNNGKIQVTGTPIYVFVGKNGALRRGKNPSQSIPCSEQFRAWALEAQPTDIGF